ncbi:MAG: universal stress protein [Thermoleophilia bacterium]
MVEPKVIVYCTDFSSQADAAFEAARALAAKWHARLLVLNMVSSGDELFGSGIETWMTFRDRTLAMLQERYVSGAGVDVEAFVRKGAPGVGIIDFVKEQRADMVVVGSRGAGSVAGFLGGGSVTDKVIKNSPVPVLVVPA